MARIVKFFGVLRRNPKKSIFFSALLAAGINYADKKIKENAMMRAFCEEAMKYGEYPQSLGDQPRHVTVLLNPAAKDGKGKMQYEQYCAPLLHLAGIKVATVRTEHEGQARELMSLMENTSAVISAGGDGTLSEVLTGLLRRADQKDVVRRLPIGILPLGHSNTASSAILGIEGKPEPRHLAEATMSVIHKIKRPMDVMEVTPQQETADGPPKPVYAASHVEWGSYRDAKERNDVYWYWATLKRYMTYVFSSYKDISWDCSAEVEYTIPCSGCSKCVTEAAKEEEAKAAEAPRRWWMAYVPKPRTFVTEEQEEIDYSQIINEECGVIHQTSLNNICDLVVVTKNTPQSVEIPGNSLLLKTGPSDVGAFDFIKEGWSREWTKVKSYASETSVGEITIRPTGTTKTQKGEERELNIDSESFEVRPMKIKAMPNAVTIFAPNPPTLPSI